MSTMSSVDGAGSGGSAQAAQQANEASQTAAFQQEYARPTPPPPPPPQTEPSRPEGAEAARSTGAVAGGEPVRAQQPTGPGAQALEASSQPHYDQGMKNAIGDATGESALNRANLFHQQYQNNLQRYGQAIDAVNASATSVEGVQQAAGDTTKVTGADDLKDDAGNALDGATVKGNVFLDTSLNDDPQALKATATEELAEAFYQDTFGSKSEGDFGAEVSSRVDGTATEDSIADARAEEDTVALDGQEGEARRRGRRSGGGSTSAHKTNSATDRQQKQIDAFNAGASFGLSAGQRKVNDRVFGKDTVTADKSNYDPNATRSVLAGPIRSGIDQLRGRDTSAFLNDINNRLRDNDYDGGVSQGKITEFLNDESRRSIAKGEVPIGTMSSIMNQLGNPNLREVHSEVTGREGFRPASTGEAGRRTANLLLNLDNDIAFTGGPNGLMTFAERYIMQGSQAAKKGFVQIMSQGNNLQNWLNKASNATLTGQNARGNEPQFVSGQLLSLFPASKLRSLPGNLKGEQSQVSYELRNRLPQNTGNFYNHT